MRGEEYRESNDCTWNLEYVCHKFVAQNTSASKHFTQNCAMQWQAKVMNEKGRRSYVHITENQKVALYHPSLALSPEEEKIRMTTHLTAVILD